MIDVVKENDDILRNLIISNRYQNVYLYIDYLTYGCCNNNIKTLIVYNSNQKPCVIIYEYFQSIQLMIVGVIDEYALSELSTFFITTDYRRLTGPTSLMNEVMIRTQKYHITHGHIMKYTAIDDYYSDKAEFAKFSDFEEIAKLIYLDKELGKGYTYDNILMQLRIRYKEKQCENMVVRIGETIVSHVATYAVLPDLVVVSGMITIPSFRGMGFGGQLLRTFSNHLISNNRTPILYCYQDEYYSWYQKLGYETIGTSSKLELSG